MKEPRYPAAPREKLDSISHPLDMDWSGLAWINTRENMMGAFWNTCLGDIPPLLSRNTQPRPVEARANFLEDKRCRKERGHSETVASHPPTPFQPLHLRPQTREMRLHGSHRPDQPAGDPAGKCSQPVTPGGSSRTVQPSHRSVRNTKSLFSKQMNEGQAWVGTTCTHPLAPTSW